MTPRTRREEAGFTLVELVIALAISSLIMGAIVASFIVGLDTTGAASTRLSQSDDRHLVEIWLPRDVTSAQSAAANQAPGCAAAVAAGATSANTVLVLTGSGVTVTTAANGPPSVGNDAYEADYVLSSSGNEQRLSRYFCDTSQGVSSTLIVSYGLATGAAAATVVLPCANNSPNPCPTAGVVTLTLKDLSGNTFAVSGLERS